MTTLFAGILLSFFLAVCGAQILRRAGFTLPAGESLIWGAGLSVGLLSYAVLLLALTGLLNSGALFLLVLIVIVSGIFLLKASLSSFQYSLPDREIFPALFLGILCLAVTFAGVLVPDLSNDSLCYHLNLPKIFLSASRLVYSPYEVNSVFPMLMEMLYTLALGIHLPHLAQFSHFGFGILTAAVIFTYGRKNLDSLPAWGAALLFVTTPGILNEISTTYVDVALAAYTILTVLAVICWTENGERRWLILAGIFSGFAMSVKYLAAISIFALILIIFWHAVTNGGANKAIRSLAVYLSAAFVCGAFWYLRSWILTGNPVFPYFYSVFKAGDPTIHYTDIGVGTGFLAFLKIPWTITMHPEIFEGYGVQIGPAYLIFIPFSFLSVRKHSWMRPLIFFSVFYLVSWFLLGQSLRFLYPVLPVWALLAGAGMEVFFESWKKIGRVILLAVLGIHTVFAVYHYRHSVKTALGLASKESYLQKWERSYAPAEFVNTNLPPDAKILAADETHLFYFKRPIVRESVYARVSGYDKRASAAQTVFETLRKDGFTHILEGKAVGAQSNGLKPFRVPNILSRGQNGLALYLKPLYTKNFTGPDGRSFVYNLYQIRDLEK